MSLRFKIFQWLFTERTMNSKLPLVAINPAQSGPPFFPCHLPLVHSAHQLCDPFSPLGLTKLFFVSGTLHLLFLLTLCKEFSSPSYCCDWLLLNLKVSNYLLGESSLCLPKTTHSHHSCYSL